MSGSVRSAAPLAHSLFLTSGSNVVVMEGVNVNLTQGYPDASDIAVTLADLTGFTVTLNGASDQATFDRDGAPGVCQVVYSDALVNQAPLVSVDVSGC